MSNRVFVISEIGINGNGNIPLTKILIRGSKEAGCDAVKFQKRIIEETYTEEFLNSERKDNNPYNWVTQKQQKEGLEYSFEDFQEIDSYCRSLQIPWFASSWSVTAQLFLRQFNLKYNKVASAMITNIPLMHTIAEEGRHTFISTGMANFEEIQTVVDIFRKYNCSFEILHCNSSYPAKNENASLPIIDILREKFKVNVGYSSHEQGRVVALGAVARGATSIEKHASFNRDEKSYEEIKEHLVKSKVKEFNPLTNNYDEVIKLLPYGSDQWASITLDEMKKLVIDIRQMEKALNLNVLRVLSEEELEVKKKLRVV